MIDDVLNAAQTVVTVVRYATSYEGRRMEEQGHVPGPPRLDEQGGNKRNGQKHTRSQVP
jgi:hypothetical protein